MEVFASAWTYLMTADRYDDFNKNGCAGVDECTTADYQATVDEPNEGAGILAGVSFASCFLVAGCVVGALL
jgi:hypothetical protein